MLELLVVLLIMALLAGYVGPKMFSELDKAKEKTALRQMKTLADALGQYRLDTGRYPDEEAGLKALIERPSNEPRWHGPYLSGAVPADPWGNPYVLHNPARDKNGHHDAEIVSLGADGRVGGTGAGKDIVYGF